MIEKWCLPTCSVDFMGIWPSSIGIVGYKWGYPKLAGWFMSWKIPFKRMMNRGNLHRKTSGNLWKSQAPRLRSVSQESPSLGFRTGDSRDGDGFCSGKLHLWMDENWGSPCFRIHLEAVPTAYESYVGFTSFISFVATKSDILLNMSYSIYIYIHI